MTDTNPSAKRRFAFSRTSCRASPPARRNRSAARPRTLRRRHHRSLARYRTQALRRRTSEPSSTTTSATTTPRYQLYKISGVDPAEFSRFPMPRPTAIFAGVLRSRPHPRALRRLIAQDSRYGHNSPFDGMSASHLPVRSYLSVPVVSRSGEILGTPLHPHGHPEPDILHRRRAEVSSSPPSPLRPLSPSTTPASRRTSPPRSPSLMPLASSSAKPPRASSRPSVHMAEVFPPPPPGPRCWRPRLPGAGTWPPIASISMNAPLTLLFAAAPHSHPPRRRLRRRIVHSDDLPNTPADLGEAVLNGGTYSAEYRAEGPDKTQRWIAARSSPSPSTMPVSSSASPAHRAGTSPIARRRKRLSANPKSSAAHRPPRRHDRARDPTIPSRPSPTSSISARPTATVPAAVHRLLSTADQELARVAQIAQQTLGFYRDTTRPGEIDLSAMLHGIVTLFSRKLQFKRLACRTHIQPSLRLYGLQGEIRQVFSNLIVNAIDASENTELTIRASGRVIAGKPGICCLIADRGTGVQPSVRERLFSPFITSKHSVGTGLGLWVTRGIVEKHGGTITYRTSTQTPTGTVFRVFLPTEVANPRNFRALLPSQLFSSRLSIEIRI